MRMDKEEAVNTAVTSFLCFRAKLGLVAMYGEAAIICRVRVVLTRWKWAVVLVQAGHLEIMSGNADSRNDWVRDRTLCRRLRKDDHRGC